MDVGQCRLPIFAMAHVGNADAIRVDQSNCSAAALPRRFKVMAGKIFVIAKSYRTLSAECFHGMDRVRSRLLRRGKARLDLPKALSAVMSQ